MANPTRTSIRDSWYVIHVRAHFDSLLAEWFADLNVQNLDNGEAELIGCLPDQAALFGVLTRLRDLGIPLISINPAEAATRLRRRRRQR